jgi:hypothetical protein
MDGTVRTGWNTQTVKITFTMIDDGLAVGQAQSPMRADLDAFTGTTTFIEVNDDFHREPFPLFLCQLLK